MHRLGNYAAVNLYMALAQWHAVAYISLQNTVNVVITYLHGYLNVMPLCSLIIVNSAPAFTKLKVSIILFTVWNVEESVGLP